MPSWRWRNQTTYADTSDLQPPVISFFNHIQSISLACQRRVLCHPQKGNVLYHAATRLFRYGRTYLGGNLLFAHYSHLFVAVNVAVLCVTVSHDFSAIDVSVLVLHIVPVCSTRKCKYWQTRVILHSIILPLHILRE